MQRKLSVNNELQAQRQAINPHITAIQNAGQSLGTKFGFLM